MFKKIVLPFITFMISILSADFTEQQVIDYHVGTRDHLEDLKSLEEAGFFLGVKTVLDVGCGDGQVTARIAKLYPHIKVVGCDISKAMLAFASKTYPASEYPNLSFIEKDACNLGICEQYDRVVSFSTLHWIKDQKRALESIYQALKPMGKALIRATPKSSNNDFKTISMKVILSLKWAPKFIGFKSTHSFHSERDYRKILNQVGFTIDRMEQKKRELIFANRESLMSFLRGILAPLAHLSLEKRTAFLDDYYRQLEDYGSVNELGEVRFCFDKIEIELTKL